VIPYLLTPKSDEWMLTKGKPGSINGRASFEMAYQQRDLATALKEV
jgi:hypothetical protein